MPVLALHGAASRASVEKIEKKTPDGVDTPMRKMIGSFILTSGDFSGVRYLKPRTGKEVKTRRDKVLDRRIASRFSFLRNPSRKRLDSYQDKGRDGFFDEKSLAFGL